MSCCCIHPTYKKQNGQTTNQAQVKELPNQATVECVSVWYVGCGQSYIIFHPSTTTSNYRNQAASTILGIELEKQGINSRAAISESAWMYLMTLISSEKQWSQHDSSIKPNALEFALGNSCRVCSHVWWELWNGICSCSFFNTNSALFWRTSWGKSRSKSRLIPTPTKSNILKLKLKKLHRFLMHDVPEKPSSKAWRQVSYHLDARKLFFNNESHMMLPPPSPLVQCSLISFLLFFRVPVLLSSSSFSLSSVSVFCRLLLLSPCVFLSPTTFPPQACFPPPLFFFH